MCLLVAKFFIFPLSGATTGPSVSWSRVQMSSLIPAQAPTNTWRSSMSVCPTVSLTLLSLNETFASSPPTLSSPIHPQLWSTRHPSSLPSLCHTTSIPVSSCHVQHVPASLSLLSSICVTPWTFHEIWPVKPPDPHLYHLYYWCAHRVSRGPALLWDSRIEAGSRADSPS